MGSQSGNFSKTGDCCCFVLDLLVLWPLLAFVRFVCLLYALLTFFVYLLLFAFHAGFCLLLFLLCFVLLSCLCLLALLYMFRSFARLFPKARTSSAFRDLCHPFTTSTHTHTNTHTFAYQSKRSNGLICKPVVLELRPTGWNLQNFVILRLTVSHLLYATF